MSITLNADTSSGLVMTSDTSGEIKLQSAGADIATVSSTGIAMASGKTLPASALTGTVPSSSVDALSTASGSAPSYSARAWVNFNGTGTVAINSSGNVSSITDNGTGDYTVNFTTAMPDANYSVSGFSGTNRLVAWNQTNLNYSTTGLRIAHTTAGSSETDDRAERISVNIFR